ncbi:MAG: Mov34/MPN/PAD-1 family protein [Thermoanaerobaculia bacterium]
MAIRFPLPGFLLPALFLVAAGAPTAAALNQLHDEDVASGSDLSRGRWPASQLLERTLRSPAYRLWQAAGFGHENTELAAWVLVDDAGTVSWLLWPDERKYLRAHWEGPRPADVVAIVHTHPAAVNPKPSTKDVETAQEIGVPVYTVSRSGIWKAVPDGSIIAVDDANWWAGCRSSACAGGPDPEFRNARGLVETRNLGL